MSMKHDVVLAAKLLEEYGKHGANGAHIVFASDGEDLEYDILGDARTLISFCVASIARMYDKRKDPAQTIEGFADTVRDMVIYSVGAIAAVGDD